MSKNYIGRGVYRKRARERQLGGGEGGRERERGERESCCVPIYIIMYIM